jgi:hypothetical protein
MNKPGGLWTVANRPMHSSTGSDHSSRSSEAKLFGIEFSDFHVSREDSVEPWCDQLDSQLFEAEYFADEDPVLVPAYVSPLLHLRRCISAAHFYGKAIE